MAPVARLGALTLLRPLLDIRKSALAGVCDAAGHPFFNDPSNTDQAYARARIRKLLPTLDELGLDTDALLRLGVRAARADAALDACARDLRARAVLDAGAQLASFDANPLRGGADRTVSAGRCGGNCAAGRQTRRICLDRLERAVARLAEALQSRKALRLTLCRLILELTGNVMELEPAPRRRTPAPSCGALDLSLASLGKRGARLD